MKYYIAGIHFGFHTDTLPLKEKIDYIIKMLKKISDDAAEYDKETSIIVLLHEYALTPDAITSEDKKACMNILTNEMKKYSNILFVPGSFATYKKSSEIKKEALSKKMETIRSNYLKAYQKTPYKKLKEIYTEYLRCNSILANGGNVNYIKNHINYITSSNTGKHYKQFPYNETNRMPKELQKNCIYHIKNDEPIRDIMMNENAIPTKLTICAEHNSVSDNMRFCYHNKAYIEIIISNTVNINSNNLFGAININMDIHRLNIYVDHTRVKKGDELIGKCYLLDNLQSPPDIIDATIIRYRGSEFVTTLNNNNIKLHLEQKLIANQSLCDSLLYTLFSSPAIEDPIDQSKFKLKKL